MTKSEAHKWGKAVEGVTGGDELSKKVCKGTGTGGTNQCGVNATSGTAQTNGKLSTVFNTDGAEAISSMETATISVQGMAGNINGLTKDEKAIVAGAFARAVEGAELWWWPW
ncbi:hypothetical protein [Anaplasma marginale]